MTLSGAHAGQAAEQAASVAGGSYIVQNNEYDSSAQECVTTDGNADFAVASSSIDNATNGSPGAYPSIYQGCHWGDCSSGGLSSDPIEVSNLTPGTATTSWSTTQTGSGAYDVAYDIWFNQTPTTTGQPNGTEIMVWLNHNAAAAARRPASPAAKRARGEKEAPRGWLRSTSGRIHRAKVVDQNWLAYPGIFWRRIAGPDR